MISRISVGALLIISIAFLLSGQEYPWIGAIGLIGIAAFFGLTATGQGLIGGKPSELYIRNVLLDPAEKVDQGDFEYNVNYAKGIIIIFSLLVILCGISAIAWQAVSELLAN